VRARTVGSTVAILAALALGNVINTHLQVNRDQLEPVLESGRVGEVAHLTYGDVEVTDVRPAMYVAPQFSDELVRKASGVYLLVSVKATATREPTLFAAAYLQDSEGRQYRSSSKADCALNIDGNTGVPAYALYCFDVPPRALAGMRFQLSRGNLTFSTLAGDHLADIDLGISAADEATWADTDAAYGAESTTREPFELQKVTLEQQDPS
jgi:hypothetical protein